MSNERANTTSSGWEQGQHDRHGLSDWLTSEAIAQAITDPAPIRPRDPLGPPFGKNPGPDVPVLRAESTHVTKVDLARKISRRGFMGLFGAAAIAAPLMLPKARSFFLPPTAGWIEPLGKIVIPSAELVYYGAELSSGKMTYDTATQYMSLWEIITTDEPAIDRPTRAQEDDDRERQRWASLSPEGRRAESLAIAKRHESMLAEQRRCNLEYWEFEKKYNPLIYA